VTKRVVVVDDDDISRRGLDALLGDSDDLIVAAAYSRAQAILHSSEWNGIASLSSMQPTSGVKTTSSPASA
jgi:DNA-binding NarL/FixJ family response regulator